jgi:hypothetical protein
MKRSMSWRFFKVRSSQSCMGFGLELSRVTLLYTHCGIVPLITVLLTLSFESTCGGISVG